MIWSYYQNRFNIYEYGQTILFGSYKKTTSANKLLLSNFAAVPVIKPAKWRSIAIYQKISIISVFLYVVAPFKL